MLGLIGFLVVGALLYFALARFELPLWMNLTTSALVAAGFAVAVAGIKRRFSGAQRIHKLIEPNPTRESLTDWLKQYGIDPDGKANDGDSGATSSLLFLALLILAFHFNPWSPTHPLDYVGLIITNVTMALTVPIIAYRMLGKILDLNTRKAVNAVISSEHDACREIVKEGNWQNLLSSREEKWNRDLDVGFWLVLTVLLAILLDRFLPWSPAFYQAHRFVCAFISILSAGVLSLLAAATLHYTKAKYDSEKKKILGIALACLIVPALFGALGGVNHLSGDSAKDVYGFEKIEGQSSEGFQTRSQRREKLVENLFGYVTSKHGLASIATAIAVALPFLVASLRLLGGNKPEYQNYNLVGIVLGVIAFLIWISS